jgi:hypothetical protein
MSKYDFFIRVSAILWHRKPYSKLFSLAGVLVVGGYSFEFFGRLHGEDASVSASIDGSALPLPVVILVGCLVLLGFVLVLLDKINIEAKSNSIKKYSIEWIESIEKAIDSAEFPKLPLVAKSNLTPLLIVELFKKSKSDSSLNFIELFKNLERCQSYIDLRGGQAMVFDTKRAERQRSILFYSLLYTVPTGYFLPFILLIFFRNDSSSWLYWTSIASWIISIFAFFFWGLASYISSKYDAAHYICRVFNGTQLEYKKSKFC